MNFQNKMRETFFLWSLFVATIVFTAAQGSICIQPEDDPQIFFERGPVVEDSFFNEISGVAASRLNQHNGGDVIWVHNDNGGTSGNIAAISVLTGKTLLVVELSQTLQSDGRTLNEPEEIAIGPCSSGSSQDCIYVGDFGHNNARSNAGTVKRNYEIHKFEEPDLSEISGNTLRLDASSVTTIPFDYDFSFLGDNTVIGADCEAMFVDPIDASIYLIPKWNSAQHSFTRIHRIPANTPNNVKQDAVAVANNANLDGTFTKADISGDGMIIAIGTGGSTRFWIRQSQNEALTTTLSRDACQFRSPKPPSGIQHEALTFLRRGCLDQRIMIEISENPNQNIWHTALAGSTCAQNIVDGNIQVSNFGCASHRDHRCGMEESVTTGSSITGSSDFELGFESDGFNSNQRVAIQFPQVPIPPGSTVTSAKLQFSCDETRNEGTPQILIRAEATDDSGDFDVVNDYIRDMSKTQQVVTWDPPSVVEGESFSTPNINILVQEVVNRPGWQDGNAMAFVLAKESDDTSVSRRIVRRDVKLIISFEEGSESSDDPQESDPQESSSFLFVVAGVSAAVVILTAAAVFVVRRQRRRRELPVSKANHIFFDSAPTLPPPNNPNRSPLPLPNNNNRSMLSLSMRWFSTKYPAQAGVNIAQPNYP